MDEMYADACPRCNSRHPAALEPLPKSYQDNFRVEVERLLESVFAGNPSGNMLAATGKALTERVAQAYTGVTDDFTTPDAAMLVHLIRDTWQLAAAKSYRQLRDLTLALTNENGKLREWSDFKEVAGKICEQYNSTWLQTEYNFAAASAQTAARRTKLEKEADIIPNLQASLAQIGVIFPQNHPYYSGVPRAEIRKSILYLPPENTYQAVKIGGHKVEVHPLHGAVELHKNLETCELLLKHEPDAKLKLLPVVEEKDSTLKRNFYPKEYIDKFGLSNADGICNREIVEFKELKAIHWNAIQNTIRKGKQQADFIVLRLPDNVDWDSEKGVQNAIYGQLGCYKSENITIWAVNNNELRKYKTKKGAT